MTEQDTPVGGRLGARVGRGGPEKLWPPSICALLAAVVYALLPDDLLVAPRYAIPALEALMVLAMLLTDRNRQGARERWSRRLSMALSGLVIGTNLTALALLVARLGDQGADGRAMLLGAMQVWVTSVIGFGLLYWELDRGGPVSRSNCPRDRMPLADFRFSQDENHDTVGEVRRGSGEDADWMPRLADYLYVSLTNSSAFSPTDSMPLSTRVKALMGLQATAALLTSLLVVARAVGTLGQ